MLLRILNEDLFTGGSAPRGTRRSANGTEQSAPQRTLRRPSLTAYARIPVARVSGSLCARSQILTTGSKPSRLGPPPACSWAQQGRSGRERRTVEGSRPMSAQYWSSRRDLFTVASKNWSTGNSRPPHVFHPSAYRAATLSAPAPLAAIVMDGRGACTHPGAIDAASYRVNRPTNGVTPPRRRRRSPLHPRQAGPPV